MKRTYLLYGRLRSHLAAISRLDPRGKQGEIR